MKSAIVESGLFRVYEDGNIERRKGDGWITAPKHKSSRGGRYHGQLSKESGLSAGPISSIMRRKRAPEPSLKKMASALNVPIDFIRERR